MEIMRGSQQELSTAFRLDIDVQLQDPPGATTTYTTSHRPRYHWELAYQMFPGTSLVLFASWYILGG
ncbi:uncharacterized protein EI90DRAFT_3082089 [Cantharellus anzutake]|uniref:uncharacterized protein n=1 Tax=Cantharellus anzutake TaxID=1750568 RepID=UPI0019084651|nr:uncharacterized protein EI90DRAFT_3082089 [Cantharellus anzutake]KAF8319471.1 hypothetical protein EI90DRAFT_3082089 [Cantharellus anzutake]